MDWNCPGVILLSQRGALFHLSITDQVGCELHHLFAGRESRLFFNMGVMGFDCFHTQSQVLSDCGGTEPFTNQEQHFGFAVREPTDHRVTIIQDLESRILTKPHTQKNLATDYAFDGVNKLSRRIGLDNISHSPRFK